MERSQTNSKHLQTGRLCNLQAKLDTAKLKITSLENYYPKIRGVLTDCISTKTSFPEDECIQLDIIYSQNKMITLLTLKRLDKESNAIRAYRKFPFDAVKSKGFVE